VSVTAPAGFEAAGVAAGLKSTGKPDVAVVVNRGPLKVGAAVFTSNRAKANPILWSQQAIGRRRRGDRAEFGRRELLHRRVRLPDHAPDRREGGRAARRERGRRARLLDGLIGTGDEVFRGKVLAGTEAAIAALSPTAATARSAIMTTDTVPKTAVVAATAGPSAAWRRARACSRRASPPCSSSSPPTPCSTRPSRRACAPRPR
jgi:glutamate N-acetyltransferase/amino-acid N-acetyltransferase